MHQVISAIVYAKDEEGAMDAARRVFDQLCENQYPFDYYVTFDEDGMGMSGKARWGDLPPVARAACSRGKKLIRGGMKATKRELMRSLAHIRRGLASLADEDIWKAGRVEANMLRHFMYRVGEYEGSPVWLYDHDGSGIRDQEHLRNALSKWSRLYEKRPKKRGGPAHNPYDGLDVWVVPADVHH